MSRQFFPPLLAGEGVRGRGQIINLPDLTISANVRLTNELYLSGVAEVLRSHYQTPPLFGHNLKRVLRLYPLRFYPVGAFLTPLKHQTAIE